MMVFEPGLHFKIPFIESVRKLDARIQTLDEAPDRFVTSEKKDLMVDSFVKWRIVDFFQRIIYVLRVRLIMHAPYLNKK